MAPKKTTSKKSTKTPKSSTETPQEEPKQTLQVEEVNTPQEEKGLTTLSIEATLDKLAKERKAIQMATAEKEKRAREEALIVEQFVRKEKRRQEEHQKKLDEARAREEAAKIAQAQAEYDERAREDQDLSLGPYYFSKKLSRTPMELRNETIFHELISLFRESPLGRQVQDLTDFISIVRWQLIEDHNPDHHRTGTHKLGTNHGTLDRVAISIKPVADIFRGADDEQAALILDAMISQKKFFTEEDCCKQRLWMNLTHEYLEYAVESANRAFAGKFKTSIVVNMIDPMYLTADQQIKLWPKGLKNVLQEEKRRTDQIAQARAQQKRDQDTRRMELLQAEEELHSLESKVSRLRKLKEVAQEEWGQAMALTNTVVNRRSHREEMINNLSTVGSPYETTEREPPVNTEEAGVSAIHH